MRHLAVPATVPDAVYGMDNAFQTAFASWPLRWFLLRRDDAAAAGVRIERIGQPDSASFDMFEIAQLLADDFGAA